MWFQSLLLVRLQDVLPAVRSVSTRGASNNSSVVWRRLNVSCVLPLGVLCVFFCCWMCCVCACCLLRFHWPRYVHWCGSTRWMACFPVDELFTVGCGVCAVFTARYVLCVFFVLDVGFAGRVAVLWFQRILRVWLLCSSVEINERFHNMQMDHHLDHLLFIVDPTFTVVICCATACRSYRSGIHLP